MRDPALNFPTEEFRRRLNDSDRVAGGRKLLKQFRQMIAEQFSPATDIEALVNALASGIDSVLKECWSLQQFPDELCLLAVGGYGRGELHPASDIDILVLLPDSVDASLEPRIESFLQLLWDIGLEPGHSVRTIAECVREGAADITIATALMESRLLAGSAEQFSTLQNATSPEQIWPVAEFFSAKMSEQQQRHARFDFSPFKLEPNIKEGPGGLRDIQNISWVTRRKYQSRSLDSLVEHGFLTRGECDKLLAGQRFLWQIRFALHLMYQRREERLLFDAQLKLARQFGFSGDTEAQAVESFMQVYYQTVMEISRLNEMLLAVFEDEFLHPMHAPPQQLNERFQVRRDLLEITHRDVFRKQPAALLELFCLLQQHPEIKGVSPATIRQARFDRDLVNDGFRADTANRQLFMQILREPTGVTHELRRMNRYGILGRYIPAFGRIIGRMQFDLFHAYTVDEHILAVVSNLRRFALPKYDHEFPLCSQIMQRLPKPELAYLAGLFHDIGKGRGGDHSELGAVDAMEFCLQHGMPPADAELVAWLVQQHLALSVTAQKKDISDPRIVQEFAQKVGDELRLDYLYVLTVADVRGTNPNLWNSWKASLFRELYDATRRVLHRGDSGPLDRDSAIRETKEAALRLLVSQGMDIRDAQEHWHGLDEEYFLRHQPGEIAWQTQILLEAGADQTVLAMRRQGESGATSLLVYANDDGSLFARVTATLDQLGLNILDARIVTVRQQQVIQTFTILESSGDMIADAQREHYILRQLEKRLGESASRSLRVNRRRSRQARIFTIKPQVRLNQDADNRRLIVEVMAADEPGLLSRLGAVFNQQSLRLRNAKITTVGERAEDVFFLDTPGDKIIDTEASNQLRQALLDAINNQP